MARRASSSSMPRDIRCRSWCRGDSWAARLRRSVFGDAFEEVGALARGLWRDGGGEGVALGGTLLFEDGVGLRHERSLRFVLREGFLLFVEDGADIERVGPGGEQGHVAIGQIEVGREVVEALRLPEVAASGDVALWVAGPVEGRGGGAGDCGVVGVGVEGAFAAEGDDDVRFQAADV